MYHRPASQWNNTECLTPSLVVVGVVDFVGMDVVLDGSSSTVPVPTTQYDLLVSRLGQVIPGFSCWSFSTDSPQEAAKLEHVAPASAVVAKSQLTARSLRTAAIAEAVPRTNRWVKRIVGETVMSNM